MYTSWSLCSSRVCFRGVWLIAFVFRQTMMSFAMIHSPRLDRVRSRHLGRIRTRKQLQCHQPISLFWMLQQRRRRTECALFALTVSTFPRNANVVERATAAAVIPSTMVKIMTLECVFTAIAFGSSDAHLNPAVTMGFAVESGRFGKFAPYLVAQMAGAFAGAVLVWLHSHPSFLSTRCVEFRKRPGRQRLSS